MRSASTPFFPRNVVVRLSIVPRSVDSIENLPDVISNPETRDSPTSARSVPGTWVFSRTWRHSGTFRGNFIGELLWGSMKVGSRPSFVVVVVAGLANASSPLIFPSSLTRGWLFASPSVSGVPVVSFFFTFSFFFVFFNNHTAHYAVETCSFAWEHVAPPASWLILLRDIRIFGEIDDETARES